MDNRKQLCVVFDIDETLIQFVQNKYRSVWDGLDESIKNKFDIIDFGKHLIILRPHIRTLFDYFKQTPNIKVGLWTYSERQYSEDIAKVLSRQLNLPSGFFMFTWGAEDMESTEDYQASGLAKDLTRVYHSFPNFNKFNTFIVDDLYKNIKHEININNSILVQPFGPLGTAKVRTDIGVEKQTKLSNDNVFIELQEICQKALRDIVNCSEADINAAFDRESIFTAKRLKRMQLDSLIKTYAIKFIKMLTIGDPMQTDEFILVNQNYGMHVKGGTNTKKRNKKYRKTRRRSIKYKYK
jgi:hypothetical protein